MMYSALWLFLICKVYMIVTEFNSSTFSSELNATLAVSL